MNMGQYTEMFIEESREYLQTLNSCLLKLEKEPNNLAVLNEIFRSAHTIKGMSATMGFATVAELTHEMENVLDILRQGKFKVTPDIVDVLLRCLDSLEQMIESVADGKSDSSFNIKTLADKLKMIAKEINKAKEKPQKQEKAVKKKLLKNEEIETKQLEVVANDVLKDINAIEQEKIERAMHQGRHIYEVEITLLKGTLLKSARAYLIMNVIDELGEMVMTVPSQDDLEMERFDYSFKVIFITDNEMKFVKDSLLNISEVEKVEIRALKENAQKGNISFAEEEFTQIKETDLKLSDNEKEKINSFISQGLKVYKIEIALREGTLLKSARSYIVMERVEEMGTLVKVYPEREELEKEKFDLGFWLLLATDESPNVVQHSLQSISEVEEVTIALYGEEKAKETVKEKEIMQEIKEEKEEGSVNNALEENFDEIKTKEEAEELKTPLPVKTKTVQSVRVDIDKLDSLLNLTGELVINKTRLEQIAKASKLEDLSETIEQMDRVTTDLQVVVMKVRMVQVGQVFNRFPRMIRDLSRDLKKKVELIIEGEETELDRTVIDEIGDPLVHLLRNAIDHALENPEERKTKGKNEMGTVRLTAHHEGNNVVIIVADNGRGIDGEAVKKKALEKGIISKAEADKMETAEAIKLLFAPGFSTAQQVTDLSGRGVGLDVVKTKIESLGGSVDVETKINEGSRFIIRLPLTLAIIQALLVDVAKEIYAIPLGTIDSTITIKPSEISTVQKQEVILLRGNIIPIVRLSKVLKVPVEREASEELFVVIVHQGDKKTGIIVDALIGQQEIVIKALGTLLSGTKQIAGATILGDGQVALILDVASIMV